MFSLLALIVTVNPSFFFDFLALFCFNTLESCVA